MKRLFYFVAAVLLSCGPLPVARATNSDPSNVASTRPNEDEDQDGLTNQEEAEFGTYPYNAYSDTDSVKDGEDGWALDPDLHPPRIRNESYAIINLGNLGFTNPIGFNNQCDILDGTLDENDPSARLWRNGQFTSIPQPNAPYQLTIRGWSWGGISDSGVCCCITTRDRRPGTSRSGTVTWRWTPGSGLQMLDYHAPRFPDSRFLNNEANVKTVTASGAVLGEGWGKQITIDNHRGFNTGIRWALGATVPTLVGDLISWTYDQKTDKSTMNTTGTFFFPRGENTSGAIIGSGTVYNSSGSNGYQNAIVSNNGTLTFLSNVAAQYGSDAFSINNAPVPMILGLKEKLPFYWLLGASIVGKRLSFFNQVKDSWTAATNWPYQVNDRFEVSGDFGLIQNGTLLDWKKKLPGYSSFWIYRINNKGCILGIGYPNGSDVPRNLLLLPVQLMDIKKVADQNDDLVIEAIPPKASGESENAYIQRPLRNKQIAYIEPHGAANNTDPEMPHLVVKMPGPQGMKVRYKLVVQYKRGNGYRAPYVNDFTRPEDTVKIPAGGDYTEEMNADQEWRIFETEDWQDELAENGFFGGTAKLYIWFPSQGAAPTEPFMTFRIGGKNPDQAKAKTFINGEAGSQFWYAYAIAKHETFGRVRENNQNRFYNQFYTDHKGGSIGDASVDMGWAAWAKGWPLYNLDRGKRSNGTRYQNGPGGYGLFQLTLGPKEPDATIPSGGEGFIKRKEIWNWQDNARGAIQELQGKVAKSQALLNGLQTTYPQSGAISSYQQFSGLDAITITYYNGMFGGQLQRVQVKGYSRDPLSCWKPQTSGWQFLQNINDYCHAVSIQIE